MPSAQSDPDAELSASVSYFPGTLRNTLTFQISPRLSGSFRYSVIEGVTGGGKLYDRSFDLRYRLVDEGRIRPAIAIGLQDFVGTGVYSGEYIVATKHLTPDIVATGGIGWGRFGSANGFANPLGQLDTRFNTRSTDFTGTGGLIESAKWFRGDAAFFGGVAWRATPKLTLKAEYSSDAYNRETSRGRIKQNSPYNFGLEYQLARGVSFQTYYWHGSQFGATLSFSLNPKRPAVVGGTDPAPQPVSTRIPTRAADLGWPDISTSQKQLRDQTARILASDGLQLEAINVEATRATVRVRTDRFRAAAQTVGRTARSLTRVLPASVETFDIVLVTRGMPVSKTSLRRSDIELLENAPDASALSYKAAKISDPVDSPREELTFGEGLYPNFSWGIGPYLSTSYFDPNSPVRAEVGIGAAASYTISPGLVLSGAVRKRAAGNKHTVTRQSDSIITRVRSDGPLYDKNGDPSLEHLTLSYHFRPGKNLYGRITAGYLETMYGGISTELLWKPVDSRLAFGAELNYVKQRNFDKLFGFQNYEVKTGHLTAYYELGNGYYAQGSVGQYLGGDLGGTVKLERIFDNGWRIGAYATLTDVSFTDFGEGSFDKGLTFTVPLDHFFGSPKKRVFNTVLQPLSRDGGARLSVQGRLYNTINDSHGAALANTWGRFWR